MDEIQTPEPEANPLEPLTPPVATVVAEHAADAGAASLASVEALLTLHEERRREQLTQLQTSLEAMPAAVAQAIRAELEAAESAAGDLPAAAGVNDSAMDSAPAALEIETVPVPMRRVRRGLRRL